MTSEQKARALCSAAYHKRELQTIEQGNRPYTQDLADRRKEAGWHLGFLLKDVAEALPAPLRQEVQACLALNERLWSKEYSNRYFETQEKTSPVCLPASDSL